MSVLIVNDSKNNHGIVLSYFFVLFIPYESCSSHFCKYDILCK